MEYLDNEQHHERRHTLTEADMALIKSIVIEATAKPHDVLDCRFSSVSPEEFMEIVKSHRSFNTMMSDSKRTIRNTMLGILVLVIMGLMTEGFWGKLISKMK